MSSGKKSEKKIITEVLEAVFNWSHDNDQRINSEEVAELILKALKENA
jgi:hypothetical protein